MKKRYKLISAVLALSLSAGALSIPVSAGWNKNGSSYTYTASDGTVPNGFYEVDSKWYYFNNGRMLTGWQKYDGNWYYMSSSGAMLTGWQKISGTWYYLYSSGRMASGWNKIGTSWYYFSAGGAMKTGWLKLGSKWYFFNGGGAMKKGWVQTGGKWYYFNNDGVMQTGWVTISDKWYYMDANGAMMTGTQTIDGATYTFSSSGDLTSGSAPSSSGTPSDTATARSLLNSVTLSKKTTTDTDLNKLVSDWISSHITSSMDNYTKAKTAYDYLLTLTIGEPDTSVVDTTGKTMDELLDLYFGGPEYNARLLLAGRKGTEEHFSAAFAALLRGIGFDAKVIEGIVYQDSEMTTAATSTWVELTIDGVDYLFDSAYDLRTGSNTNCFCRTLTELGNRYQKNDTFEFKK